MNSSYVSWNMRGALSEEKARALRRIVRKFKPHIVAIQETKLENLSEKLVDFLWGIRCRSWLELPVEGK